MRTALDNIYLGLDIGLPGALLRIVLGICLVLAIETMYPDAGLRAMSAALVMMLLAFKALAGIARRVVPASPLVRRHWEWRRNLARHYDSYQWRKLLWFGTGILIDAVLSLLPGNFNPWILGAACVVAGITGEMLWRRHNLAIVPPPS